MALAALAEIRSNLISKGFFESTEQYGVCNHAMNYVGMPYLRSEELSQSTIDCSTLVSQSHWEGALIGVPFTADGQRRAASGVSIERRTDLQPGDVLVRYESVEASPDKQFNHVAIFLGTDCSRTPLLIESRGGKGVILTPLHEFPNLGGIRRFIAGNMKCFDSEQAKRALDLSKFVPKLARIGARQYSNIDDVRFPHKGLDIYQSYGAAVFAPISGVVSEYFCEVEGRSGLQVSSDQHPGLTVRMLHARCTITSSYVLAGGQVGFIDRPPDTPRIKYVEGISAAEAHLHFEVEYLGEFFCGVGASTVVDGRHFFNGLYLAKRGLLQCPL